jgi:hypothetical protein
VTDVDKTRTSSDAQLHSAPILATGESLESQILILNRIFEFFLISECDGLPFNVDVRGL